MIRLNLTVSDDLARGLEELSGERQTSKSEILRKALTLFDVARDGRRSGKKLALVGAGGQLTTEIVGLRATTST
jgi:predicted transcriptional regulator